MASTSSSSTSSTSTWFSATLTSTMLPFSTFSTSSFRRTCFWVVVFMRLEVLCVRSSATFYGDEADRIDDHLTEAEQERQMYPGRASAALFSGGEFPGASTEEGGREGRQPSIRLLYQQPPVGTVVPRLTLPPAACAVEDGPHVVTVHGKPDKRSRSCNPALKEALSRSISDEKWQELEDERSGTARTTRRRLNGTEEASVPAQKETSSSLVEDTANVVRGPTRLGTPFVRVGDEWVLSGDPYAAADSRGWRGAENDRVSGHYTNPASSPQASPRGTLHMSAVLGTVLSEIEKDGQQKAAATQETGGLEGGEDDMEEGSTQGTKKLPTLRKRTRTDSQSTLSHGRQDQYPPRR
ncbi:unnamed protein product [Amoebophrya sp. A25]|nr:unnamed protein product [Amoebophrya sp. A25]|eukprot:GSA25T00009168001.1